MGMNSWRFLSRTSQDCPTGQLPSLHPTNPNGNPRSLTRPNFGSGCQCCLLAVYPAQCIYQYTDMHVCVLVVYMILQFLLCGGDLVPSDHTPVQMQQGGSRTSCTSPKWSSPCVLKLRLNITAASEMSPGPWGHFTGNW